MIPWFDVRTVRFEFYADHPKAPGSEPEYVIVSEIPSFMGVDPNAEETVRIIEDARKESGYPPNFMVDTRTQTDWGASGGAQEIIIQLMTDPGVRYVAEDLAWKVAQGGALGAGSLMAQNVLKKLGETRRREQEQAEQYAEKDAEERGDSKPEPVYEQTSNLDQSIMRAQISIASTYRVEWSDLDMEGAERVRDGARVMLRHMPSGRRFSVKVDSSGYAMSIKPLKPSQG